MEYEDDFIVILKCIFDVVTKQIVFIKFSKKSIKLFNMHKTTVWKVLELEKMELNSEQDGLELNLE